MNVKGGTQWETGRAENSRSVACSEQFERLSWGGDEFTFAYDMLDLEPATIKLPDIDVRGGLRISGGEITLKSGTYTTYYYSEGPHFWKVRRNS